MIDTWPTSLLIIATVLSCPVLGLLVDERNISGTGSEDYLTDKQLAIQRYSLTYTVICFVLLDHEFYSSCFEDGLLSCLIFKTLGTGLGGEAR